MVYNIFEILPAFISLAVCDSEQIGFFFTQLETRFRIENEKNEGKQEPSTGECKPLSILKLRISC